MLGKQLGRLASSALLVAGLGLVHVTTGAPATAAPVPGLQTVTAVSAVSSDTFRQTTVRCPQNKVVVGGGAQINGGTVGGTAQVAVTAFTPLPAGNGFVARAYEDRDGWIGSWSLRVFALCAHRPSGWEIKTNSSPWASPSTAAATARCTPGKVALGTGGAVSPGRGVVVLTGVVPTRPTTDWVVAHGQETQGGFTGSWNVTAWAICASKPMGHDRVVATSRLGPATPKTETVACPAGAFGHGTGFLIANGMGQVYLHKIVPNAVVPTNITATAFEDQDGYAPNWSLRSYGICAA